MSDPHLPSKPESNDDESQPEVRLELTRAGVQEVLSLYSQEQHHDPEDSVFRLRFEDFERAVRERRRMLVMGAVGGFVLAGLLAWLATPLFPVSAQVVLERHDMTQAESPGRVNAAGSSFVATQAQVMESESVLADAVARVPRSAHLDAVDTYETEEAAAAAALGSALEAVQASPVSGTQVIALGYLGPDAQHGVALLTEIVSSYHRALREHEAAVQSEKLRAKQAEIDVLEAESVELESRLAALRTENGTAGSAQDTADAQNLLLRDLAEQLGNTRNERIALENRLATGSEQLAILDPATRSLQQQLWAAEAELSRVQLSLTPRHPAVEAAQREVSVLSRQLEESAKATPDALKRDIAAAVGLEAQLSQLYEQERLRMSTVERDRREESLLLAEWERVRTLSDQRRSELLDQRLVTRLVDTGETGVTARLIAHPKIPDGAVWPRPKLMLPLGLLLGLAVGFAAALISLARERERFGDERESWTGVPSSARNGAAYR